MPGRLAITGVDGFVGSHVAHLAAKAGFDVVGIGRRPTTEMTGLTAYVGIDLAEAWPEVPDVDVVIHLAALAAVGPSFEAPLRYVDVNAAITINMCEALLRTRPNVRVIAASTGALYSQSQHPLNEDSPLAFTSPYAVSKATAEHLLSYYANRGLDVVVARPFNHIGPGQGEGFIVPDLTRRLRSLGHDQPLSVGNLDAERDYTDVRDVAMAYLAMAKAPELPERLYNVASGQARSGHEVLAAICRALGRDVPPVVVDRSRPLDIPRVIGDASRLRSDFGWAPRVEFETSISDAVAAVE